jgi:hypothetical protein
MKITRVIKAQQSNLYDRRKKRCMSNISKKERGRSFEDIIELIKNEKNEN